TTNAPRPASSQQILPQFQETNGPVYAVQTLGDRVYLGGAFSRVGPHTGHGAVLDSTGALARAGSFDGTVYSVVADGDGGWFVGGNFSKVGGVAHEGLVHLLSDGTVSDWNPSPDQIVLS